MDIRIIKDGIKFKYRVTGIIIKDGSVLVDRYGNKGYVLPGGCVEFGETSYSAIKRELLEETQIDFKDLKYLGITENFFENLKGEKTHAIEIYYITIVSLKDVVNLDMNYVENDKGYVVNHRYEWIPIRYLANTKIYPEISKQIILKGLKDFHYIVKE